MTTEPSTQNIKIILAGWTIAVLWRIANGPIERVMILLQTQTANPRIQNGRILPYTNGITCLIRVIEEQGAISLWRGTLINIIRYFSQQVLSFLFRDLCHSRLPRNYYLADGLVDAATSIICYPLEIARVRFATDMTPGRPQYSGLFDLSLDILEERGLSGFFSGITSAMISGLFHYSASCGSSLP